MYETLVIFTGFALATYEEGKQGSNAETVKVSRQLAGQNLLAITGILPEKIAFTDKGLSNDNGPAVANDFRQRLEFFVCSSIDYSNRSFSGSPGIRAAEPLSAR
jgi:hypothetical protein